jgi:hypothetical protein
MTRGNLLWLGAGLIVGGLHAASLWHAARRVSYTLVATGALRLLVIALLLVGAALAGGLLPVCVGWGVGFLVSARLMLHRSKMP